MAFAISWEVRLRNWAPFGFSGRNESLILHRSEVRYSTDCSRLGWTIGLPWGFSQAVSWSTLAAKAEETLEEKSAPLAWGALWERAPKGWTEANLKTFIIILYSVTFSLRSSLLTKMDDQRENPTSWQRKRPTYNVNLVVNSTTKPSHLRALKSPHSNSMTNLFLSCPFLAHTFT